MTDPTSSRADRAFLLAFGTALVLTGLWLWSRGSLALPTRRPPEVLRLQGLPLALFGLSPILAGAVLLSGARTSAPLDPRSLRDPRTLTFLLACAAMVGAVLLAERAG